VRFYFDTNPLIYWVEGAVVQGNASLAAAAARVRQLIENMALETVVSETTLIEFHDVLQRLQRDSERPELDAAWAHDVYAAFMEWVRSGSLGVLEPRPRTVEIAMGYISMAQEQGRALNAWDAAHLCRAMEWARETGESVTIVTGNLAFENFLELFPAVAQFVQLEKISAAS
jgi:hypothetical protein